MQKFAQNMKRFGEFLEFFWMPDFTKLEFLMKRFGVNIEDSRKISGSGLEVGRKRQGKELWIFELFKKISK